MISFNKPLLFFVILCFGSGVSKHVAADEVPTSLPSAQLGGNDSLARQVHAILGQTDAAQVDLLEPLAAVMSYGGDPSKASTAEIDRLVDVLLTGNAGSALLMRENGQVHIQTLFADTKDWKYGSPAARMSLINRLWSTAVALNNVDGAGAARFAQASILLAAYDEVCFGRSTFVGLVRKTDVSFVKVAALTVQQAETLETLARKQELMVETCSRFRFEVGVMIDKWVDSKAATLETVQRKEIMNRFQACWASCNAIEAPDMAWRIMNTAWKFLNFARSRNDEATVQAIKDMLLDWKSRLSYPDAKRWIDEAIATNTPPPAHMNIMIDPKSIRMSGQSK